MAPKLDWLSRIVLTTSWGKSACLRAKLETITSLRILGLLIRCRLLYTSLERLGTGAITRKLCQCVLYFALEGILRCVSLASLRSTTRRQRQRHKFCIFSEQKQKLCTPFTCFFFISVHFFPVLGKSATWNAHFSSFNENMNTQARIGIFFPSLDTAPLNSVPELSKVTQTEIMAKKIDRLELAILSDVFSTVAS